MRFSAAELAEIRKAFRQRIATAPARKRAPRANRKREPSPKRKSEPKAAPVLVREPEYDDGDILTPGEIAELFAVSPRTVRLWADAGRLPSFRTVGGQRRSDGRTFGAPQVPDFVQGVDELLQPRSSTQPTIRRRPAGVSTSFGCWLLT
jgi:excisionase family DNA binding protein